MSDDRQPETSVEDVSNEPNRPQIAETEAAVQVQLDDRSQRRNVFLYVLKWCLVYLAAPVLYVGFVQAGLCKRLGASDFVANLPSSAYLLLAAFPIIMAWAVPQVRYLKRVMTIGYVITGAMGAITAAVLWLPVPNWLRIAVVIGHAAIVACSSGTAWAFEWELLGRGVSESRRGTLFAITFSVGPLCAVVGSLGAQLVIAGEIFGWTPSFWREIPYPVNYTVLYGATLPLMFLAAFLVNSYVVPRPAVEVQRQPFVQGVFGGFGRLVSYRLILIACLAYLLIYSGTMIQNNMVLFTREAVGLAEDTFVGYQLAIRFGCKVFAGLMLGWLLKRTNPRMNLYMTALLVICGVVWILIAPLFGVGLIFLIAFGLNGAGELMGFYYPYYVLCLSPKSQMRRNMAFVMLLSAPVGLAPALYGAISDTWNLTASFWVALVVMVVGVILVVAMLPARPRPRAEDLEPADLEQKDS
ncbi:MAG: MFS transporter [Planctomycetes bacterium]|nr:MFS transporter [Planctomycetota bacterium]MBL7038290.1 MFS transporter [Pirellulaceae bacterium]